MAADALRKNDMTAHLMDALDRGEDIGHYGRLVFVMVGRHFMDEDELVRHLKQRGGHGRGEGPGGWSSSGPVRHHNPPKRERIMEWQAPAGLPHLPPRLRPRRLQRLQEPEIP